MQENGRCAVLESLLKIMRRSTPPLLILCGPYRKISMKSRGKVKSGAALGLLVLAWVLPAFCQVNRSNLQSNLSVVASTVPGNGDVNPCGVVRILYSEGSLVEGNILVSNFNNSKNFQGTGTTIVQITPDGTVTLFAQIDAALYLDRVQVASA
jgi:hypothetical protein